MPFDHYVSQVHLKNFNSPALDGKLNAICKSDLKRFQTRSRDICRIEDGSTNPYLAESRAIEEFLKDVEPRYNASLVKLRKNKPDQESIFCIAGFVAYIVNCSPAAMRIHSGRSIVSCLWLPISQFAFGPISGSLKRRPTYPSRNSNRAFEQ
jgi:hypothetical protein